MSPLFCVNAVFPALVLLALGAANLFTVKERSIHARLAALGFCAAAAITCFEAVPLGLAGWTDPWVFATAFFCWMTGLLYLSFLIEMTSTRRSALFPLSYVLPLALAIASAALPRPLGLAAFTGV